MSELAPPMPISCDLCGQPIWSDQTPTPVTADTEDNESGGTVDSLLACPECVDIGPGVWIFHRRWSSLRSAIVSEWAR